MAEALAKMAGRIFAEIIGGKKEVPILNTRKRPISEARNLSVEESVGRSTCEGRCIKQRSHQQKQKERIMIMAAVVGAGRPSAVRCRRRNSADFNWMEPNGNIKGRCRTVQRSECK